MSDTKTKPFSYTKNLKSRLNTMSELSAIINNNVQNIEIPKGGIIPSSIIYLYSSIMTDGFSEARIKYKKWRELLSNNETAVSIITNSPLNSKKNKTLHKTNKTQIPDITDFISVSVKIINKSKANSKRLQNINKNAKLLDKIWSIIAKSFNYNPAKIFKFIENTKESLTFNTIPINSNDIPSSALSNLNYAFKLYNLKPGYLNYNLLNKSSKNKNGEYFKVQMFMFKKKLMPQLSIAIRI